LQISNYITASRAANLNKIVIDVQSNAGCQPLLAIDAFKHFFPNIDPFGGSRLRAHHAADVIGQTTTTDFQSLSSTSNDFITLIASEWVATERINANTNQTFASWAEFFGPQEDNGDEEARWMRRDGTEENTSDREAYQNCESIDEGPAK
jgi:hypothetical protein